MYDDDFKMDGILSSREFVLIGNTIAKHTNPLEKNLEEMLIGINLPTDEETIHGDQDCEIIENEPTYEITTTDTMDIKYFQDGIQRTQFLGNVLSENLKRLAPIVFCTVGGIIVKLEDQHVKMHLEPIIYEKFIVPEFKYLPKEITSILSPAHCIEVKGFERVSRPEEFRKKIFMEKVQALRKKVELEIITRFEETNPDDWLVIDGYIYRTDISDKKIGIVKRHGKNWLDNDVMYNILRNFVSNNGKKIRSTYFTIKYQKPPTLEVISCYMKLLYQLQSPLIHNPEFSLIRVETPEKYKDKFETILNTILSFNTPFSKPSDSWDKKIYPILMAEKILKTYTKDQRLISAAFNRM